MTLRSTPARAGVLVLLGFAAVAGWIMALRWPMPSCADQPTAEACDALWQASRAPQPVVERLISEPLAWPVAFLVIAGVLMFLWHRRDRARPSVLAAADEAGGSAVAQPLGLSGFLFLVALVGLVAILSLLFLGTPMPDVLYIRSGPIH